MTKDRPDEVVSVQSKPQAFGNIVIRGAAWTIALALAQKVLSASVQFGLAWLLLPREMGIAGMAFAAASAMAIFRSSSLHKVLVQRQDRFEQDAPRLFWLAMSMSIVAALALLLAAPTLAELLHQPELKGHLALLAALPPISALATLHSAQLYRDLRFRTLSLIHLGEALIISVLGLILAAVGFGAYSLTIPPLLSTLFAVGACRFCAGEIPVGRPTFRGWPELLGPAAWLMLLGGVEAVEGYGVNFILGRFQGPESVGYYSWGFLISAQVVLLVSRNLQNVFFPALSQLQNDTQRLQVVFEKSCRVLTAGIVPVCVLQSVLAEDLVVAVFNERWQPAIPVIRWLSLGLLTQPVSVLTGALLLARGGYAATTKRTALVCAALITAAFVGARAGDHTTVAVYVSWTLLVCNFAAALVTVGALGQGWTTRLVRGSLPLLLVVPVWIAAEGVNQLVRQQNFAVQLVLVSGCVVLLEATLLRLFWPDTVREISSRLQNTFLKDVPLLRKNV